jgi:hypothetical protein
LKPIDFKRLGVLLNGIVDEDIRVSCLYRPGKWEKGGWFRRTQPSFFDAKTIPSELSPIQHPPPQFENPQPDRETLDEGETGSITPTPKPELRKPFIHDERLDGVQEGDDKASSALSLLDGRVEDVTDDPTA